MAGKNGPAMSKFVEKLHQQDMFALRIPDIIAEATAYREWHRLDSADNVKESNEQKQVRRSVYYSALLTKTLVVLQST